MKICGSVLGVVLVTYLGKGLESLAFSPKSFVCSSVRWTIVGMSKEDDFYADYDESEWSSPEKNRRRGRRTHHHYTRDVSRDQSNVNEEAVMELIRQRTDARSRGDYDRADSIREDLLHNYAVGIDDKTNSWRTGCSSSGSGQKYGGGGGRSSSPIRRQRYFGPNGHDYDAYDGPNTSQFTEKEIHFLLKERLQAKRSRNFNDADRIQAHLINGGVFVHDGKKEWRADGIPYTSLQRNSHPSDNNNNALYTKSSYSSSVVDDRQDQLIDRLVKERAKFKMMKEFEKADAIRDGLQEKFGVSIDDRIQQWSVGGDFGPEHNAQRDLSDKLRSRSYMPSESSNHDPDDLQFIQQQVDARFQAKQQKDFDAADDIRDLLKEQFYVTINDKQKLWSAGGVFSELGHKPKGVYHRRGGGNLTDEEESAILQQLDERSQAKKDRDFQTADTIRDRLLQQYNVKIDDRSGEWRVDTADYAMSHTTNQKSLTTEQVQNIQSLLKQRYSHKQQQEYEEADSIRDNLKQQFGVTIDDRTKEWSIDEEFLDKNNPNQPKNESNDPQILEDDIDDALEAMFNENNDKEMSDVQRFVNSEDNQENVNDDIAMSEEELSKLTVPLLKEKLKIVGLKVSGKKSDLIARLLSSASH